MLATTHSIPARDASMDELTRVHSAAYLRRVQELAASGGGDTGSGAPITATGWQAAMRSAGSALAAVDAVMSGQVTQAYALTRPPGHHAEPEMGMGFCVLANAALLAEQALQRWGARRVAILDWDVHFGNGTQKCFEHRSDVLTISIHQEASYVAVRGEADELGEGQGYGYNLNVPLPAGCGFGAYRYAFERIVLPALEAFRPDLVVVACGYDAGRLDPLGRMLLDGLAFRWMTEAVQDVARRHSGGRLVFTHEGGYCPVSVPFFGLAVMEQLSGSQTEVACPLTAQHGRIPGQTLEPWQKARVEQLAAHFDGVRQQSWV